MTHCPAIPSAAPRFRVTPRVSPEYIDYGWMCLQLKVTMLACLIGVVHIATENPAAGARAKYALVSPLPEIDKAEAQPGLPAAASRWSRSGSVMARAPRC